MASPSSSSPKPTKPQKKDAFVGPNSKFPRNEELPIKRNYSSNSNSPFNYNTARVAGPRPVRTKGTELHGRIRNKKKTRGKRRKSGKKTKHKKKSSN